MRVFDKPLGNVFLILTQHISMAIYGARVRTLGQTEYFKSEDKLKLGSYALLNAEQGTTVGEIVSGPLTPLKGSAEDDLPEVIRPASAEDMETYEKNGELRKAAIAFCKERISARKLEMKLVDVEIYFDRGKFIFYFTAPNRVDFRELVKDLVREYRSRIELRQIGVRHETQILGAIGNCGMPCCCKRYLRKFAPVTIKMAKEQNLFLNPSKISGICGRLLCCLSYEQENYERFNAEAPRAGKKYRTDKGTFKVCRADMFKNVVYVLGEDNEERAVPMEEWKAANPVCEDPEPRSERSGEENDLYLPEE